ncbi:MAG TPA: AcvB/VirJ family lysyl-phosphatidylglycerol hydrolase [Caulobacteraceae bacterium]|jgi:type IV secretory pathway VirJ component|nr:AcvB/VirJ family lysyl-phosphatidylglycerol hydrolase [Caulobacteraceae bacterium]
MTARRLHVALLAAAFALAALGGAAARAQSAPDDGRLARFPPIVAPTAAAGDTFVVLYSGDSGWAGAARGFSAALVDAGEPVVGVDSLGYFFLSHRSPPDGAADLAAVIEHYAAAWDRPRVILVGYSFGADSLPLIVERLPAEARARVRLMALISPADRADMLFTGLSWIDLTLPGAQPLAPALLTLASIPAICIRAEHDPRAACDRFPQGVARFHLPGWHRYHGQYRAVARIILSSAGLPPPDAEAPPAPLSR